MTAVLVLLLIGVAFARVPGLPARAPVVLDVLVIWLALPGLILVEVPRLTLDAAVLVPVGAAWGTLVVVAAAVWCAARLRGWSRRTLGTLLLVAPLGNTSFLGIPAVTALLGREHVGTALVYDQLGSFLALATWGTVVAARFGVATGGRPSVAATARRVLAFPPFVALLVALALRWVPLPGAVTAAVFEVAGLLGATLVPLTMLAVGMRLRLPRGSAVIEPMVVGLVAAMALAPAVVWAAAWALDGRGPAWQVSLLEAAMPPQVTASVLAAAVGLDDELASALVGVGVLVAMVSAPLWAGLPG